MLNPLLLLSGLPTATNYILFFVVILLLYFIHESVRLGRAYVSPNAAEGCTAGQIDHAE